MKMLSVCFVLFFTSFAFGQSQSGKDNISKDSIGKFRLSFSTFNYAARVYSGTTTYILTESSLKVTKAFFGSTKRKTIYSKSNSKIQKIASAIMQIGLGSLDEFYYNYCVMVTSGDMYFLDFTIDSTTKNVILHHYYLKQLDDIIKLINSGLPKKYQFQYLTKDTKQDCDILE